MSNSTADDEKKLEPQGIRKNGKDVYASMLSL